MQNVKVYKHSAFFRSLGICILIVLVMVAVILPIYINIYKSAINKVLDETSLKIQSDLNSLASQMKNIESTLTRLTTNAGFDRISVIKGNIENSDYVRILSAQKYLSDIASANSLITDIIVTFAFNEIIITKYNSFTSHKAFDNFYRLDSLKSNIINSNTEISPARYNTSTVFLNETVINSPAISKNTEVLVLSMPLYRYSGNSYQGSYGSIYVLINKGNLLDSEFIPFLEQGGFLFIKDSNARVIAQYGQNIDSSDLTKLSLSDKHYEIIGNEEKEYYLSFIAGIPKDAFSDVTREANISIFTYAIAAMLAGVTVSIYASVRQNQPVRLLVRDLEQRGYTLNRNKNEYLFFLESLEKLENEKQSEINNVKDLLRTSLLNSLVNGYVTEDLNQQLLVLLPNFPKDYKIGYGRVNSNDEHLPQGDMINIVLMDSLKRSLPDGVLFHTVGLHDFVVFIDANDITLQDFTYAVEALNKKSSFKVSFALSKAVHSPWQAGLAHEEAKIQYMRRENPQFFADVEAAAVPLSANDVVRLYHTVTSGDEQGVNEQIYRMVSQCDIPNFGLEQLYTVILFVFLLSVHTNGLGNPHIPYYRPDLTPEKNIDNIYKAGEIICRSINDAKKSHNHELKSLILKYVDEHCLNSETYGKQIADYFSISEKYCYTFFKEQTGSTLGEYLQMKRLKHAETLLTDSNHPIGDIYKLSGFNSHNTFFKAFRRVYGVSPTQYRSANKT